MVIAGATAEREITTHPGLLRDAFDVFVNGRVIQDVYYCRMCPTTGSKM